MKDNQKTKYLNFCYIAVALTLGFFAHTFFDSLRVGNTPLRDSFNTDSFDRNKKEGFNLINPLLACADISNISNRAILDLRDNVSNYIGSVKKDGLADTVAVYFRDLNNGPWFGLDEKTIFTPGSLLKVPFAIGLYKLAEESKNLLLKNKLYDKPRSEFVEYFFDKESIAVGNTYSVEDLIRSMIVRSDNNAAMLLTDFVDKKYFAQVYDDLGIDEPQSGQYEMSVRTYASFFRILFNATYLDKEYSEQLLAYLTQTTFDKGLRAGVPANILVAHKFGERSLDEANSYQLHDCGIVYYPGQPYLLCVMTRGNNFDELAKIIKNISRIVYEGGGRISR